MSSTPTDLYSTVAEKDYLSLYSDQKPNAQKVIDFLRFRKRDVATATEIAENSIRYDQKIPVELERRLNEWANLINLVAGHFHGDAQKTATWFTMPNTLLGGITPRDMIRVGRYNKLLRFVLNAREENDPKK